MAILIGGAYLLIKKSYKIENPLAYLLTLALGTWIFAGPDGFFTGDALYQVIAGGVMLGAFFMATDYTTTPYTPVGQIIFGIGCRGNNCFNQSVGRIPEGCSYSILLMNIVTPLIDRITAPKRYGASRKRKEAQV